MVGAELGSKLRNLREEKGKSLMQVCNEIGLGAATLGYYETSHRTPSLTIAHLLCFYYNVSLDWLCGRTKEKEVAKG